MTKYVQRTQAKLKGGVKKKKTKKEEAPSLQNFKR